MTFDIEAMNLTALGDGLRKRHQHLLVARVNDHVLKIAVNEDPFPWHNHPNSDELFIVVEGELTVEFDDGSSVTLEPDDTLVVPQGRFHRTRPRGRTVNLLVERADAETEFRDKQPD